MNGAERFLADHDPVAVTVDVVALTIRDAGLQVLLARRGEQPFQGSWALPGGFVRPRTGPDGERTEEDLAQTAARELAEEAGPRIRPTHLEQLGSYGAPGRDPRMRIISVAYLAFAPEMPEATPGTDAADAQWVPVSTLGLTQANGAVTQRPGTTRPLAFDHPEILADGVERARAKLEYTPLATAFVRAPFTISELREVYETVWGEKLHAGNFHRKVLSVPGFVESAGDYTETGGPRGGPRAKLYRRGNAILLRPALLRPSTHGIGKAGISSRMPGSVLSVRAPEGAAGRAARGRSGAPGRLRLPGDHFRVRFAPFARPPGVRRGGRDRPVCEEGAGVSRAPPGPAWRGGRRGALRAGRAARSV